MQKRFRNKAVVSLIVFLVMMQAGAQISPGKLSDAHAHLEGLSNCTKCHVLGEKVSDEKCLDCHTEIAKRIREQKGYHSSAEVKANNCFKCHSEHHGRNFQMIHFETEKFDHSQTGYTLQGKHRRLVCGDCHKSDFIADPRIKVKETTYMGLDRNCSSCHTDVHQGTLSQNCSSCHSFEVFKPASEFEHKKTRFKLLGKHSSVECGECHKASVRNGVDMQQFAGVPFENCTSCHKDVHDDKFGQNCSQCHSEESFKRIKQLTNFNHTRTSYPLEGKHQFVSCSKCHKSNYTADLSYSNCSDCHSDYHDHEFIHQGQSPDCSNCHSTLGFEQSDFTVDRHNKTDFELSGAHLATPCFACHKKDKRWNFREMGNNCIDCHENIHETSIDKKYYPDASCENCHNSNRWSEIEFDHSKTDFILEGAHLRQSCRSCHFREDEAGILHQEFSELSLSCTNCHQDVHYGQFEEAGEMYCLKCHDNNNWSASRFDHDQTAFKLDGKHKDVACNKCHLPVVSGQLAYTLYKLNDTSCESCH